MRLFASFHAEFGGKDTKQRPFSGRPVLLAAKKERENNFAIIPVLNLRGCPNPQ
jgi:hypothetical protein